MTELADVIRAGLSDTTTVRIVTGIYVEPSGSQVVVSIGESAAPMPLIAAAWPMPGERVLCANLDGRWLCFGSETPRQQWGKVISVGAGNAVVEYPPGSGVRATMLTPAGETPAVGQFALLNWANGGVVVRLYGGVPAPRPTPEPTAPATNPVTRVFRASDAGSADGNGRWIANELFARTSPQGAAAWFYGTAVRDAVGSRTVTGGRIYIPIRTIGSGDILFGYHTLLTKQQGRVPDILAASVQKPAGGWHTLPIEVAQGLAGAGRGVSFRTNSGGAPSYKSLAQDPLSGQLELTFR